MTSDLLSGLSPVLSALGTAPHPDALAACIAENLGDALAIERVAILGARTNSLVVIGLAGYDRVELDELESIPLDADYPVVRAYYECEVLIEPSDQLHHRYEGMAGIANRWQRTLDQVPTGCTVAAPVLCHGRPVGAYALVTGKDDWSTLDLSTLNALSHALGLWLTHPDSGLPTGDDEPAPELTARQRRILSLAANGWSNPAIAAALGLSPSTVKQEVGRIMRSLDAQDRHDAVTRAARLGLLESVSP